MFTTLANTVNCIGIILKVTVQLLNGRKVLLRYIKRDVKQHEDSLSLQGTLNT